MSTYKIGTATVNNGSTSVTGSGTAWVAAGIRAGDHLFVNGLFAEIASVQSNTSLTLVRGWPGSNANGQQYSIALIDDGQRSIASLNQVLQSLGQGSLTSLAALNAGANEMPYWTGAGVMGKTALTAAARALLGRAVIETQSATDTTSGRLMRVGNFGLGVFQDDQPSSLRISDAFQSLPSGFFSGPGSSGANYPNSTARFYPFINSIRRAGSGSWNEVRLFLAGLSRLTIGVSDSAGPWAYSEIFTQHNILGTVSQSDGIPTGAIIQRGSNSNGEFVRFADGTQLCWVLKAVQLADPVAQTDMTLSYPASFLGVPTGFYGGGPDNAGGAGFSNKLKAIHLLEVAARNSDWRGRLTPAVASLHNSSELPDPGTVFDLSCFAIGRWF